VGSGSVSQREWIMELRSHVVEAAADYPVGSFELTNMMLFTGWINRDCWWKLDESNDGQENWIWIAVGWVRHHVSLNQPDTFELIKNLSTGQWKALTHW